jgi:hypothetical protein
MHDDPLQNPYPAADVAVGGQWRQIVEGNISDEKDLLLWQLCQRISAGVGCARVQQLNDSVPEVNDHLVFVSQRGGRQPDLGPIIGVLGPSTYPRPDGCAPELGVDRTTFRS